MFFVLVGMFFAGCVKEGPMGPEGPRGPQGRDGNANVFSSQWISPQQWNGQTGDWYFDVANSAITEDVVESGVILAYLSIPNDIYPDAVRPMPAYVNGANWEYLIPEYGMIEFTSDALERPGTNNYYFRFVIIPANLQLKSGSINGATLDQLRVMPYSEVCKKLGIPE